MYFNVANPMSSRPRKKLPIGIQTLSEILSDGYYYVDKTGLAHQLISQGKYYFLSRPRRFGKSLFLDTLKEIFEGNQALFEGLAIHDKWDWASRFPVIRISFNDGGISNRAELDRRIRSILRVNFQRLGLACPDLDDIIDAFGELIRTARKAWGQRVVVLVDEYDKPLLDNIEDAASTLAIREGLKALYSVIKGADEDIRFAFVTGISKFSKVSMFSGMNNLNDLTMHPNYSALCGYTDFDLDQVFAPELPGLDRAKIRQWYNGYNWTGEAVYNPFDLLLFFENRRFRPWWFETGTPGFLVKLMAERGFYTPRLAQLRCGPELISTFDVDQITIEALLFQSGYLTITHEEELLSGMVRYTLGYPNLEVEFALNSSLLGAYTSDASTSDQLRTRLYDLLQARDVPGLRELFHAFFAGIPYNWYTNNSIAQYEGFYASVFYSYFASQGFDLRVEDATNHGRIDMTVILPGQIYLFEFKVVELLPEGRALQQLQDKAYADKYRALGLPVSLIGVEFSRESRNVVGFEVAQLG
jgi:Predicted AAA-ATPase/PD-(D/E)XK nuclease superfamily